MIAQVHCHLESGTFQKADQLELCCLALRALIVLAKVLTSSFLRNRCFTERKMESEAVVQKHSSWLYLFYFLPVN